MVNHCDAKPVFVESDVADNLLAARDRLGRVPEGNLIGIGGAREGLVPYEALLDGGDGPVEESDGGGAVVIYTSGTTGKPKGVVRKFPKEMRQAVLRFILETPKRIDDRHLVGVNVYPAEVEETLMRHPAVAEAAVIGVPDDEWGERVRAFVSLRRGEHATAQDIVAWARRELSGPKVPREVVLVAELPKNPTGKVLKRALRG